MRFVACFVNLIGDVLIDGGVLNQFIYLRLLKLTHPGRTVRYLLVLLAIVLVAFGQTFMLIHRQKDAAHDIYGVSIISQFGGMVAPQVNAP